MFALKPNDDLEFIESSHTYLYRGVIIPSVTQLMKGSSEAYYRGISEARLAIAADRGTRVHLAIYEYETQDKMTDDEEVKPYLTEYIIAKKRYKFQPLAQEFKLTNGIFAGTLDMLAEFNGRQVIIDLKATSVLNKSLAEIQLAGYDELCTYNGIGVNECYILHLTKDKHKLHRIMPRYTEWTRLVKEYLNAQNM